MSKCDVVIEFDRTDRTFTPADTISGKVRVTANKDVAGSGVEIEALWRTHGRGNRAGGSYETITFPGEQLRAGDTKMYEFSIEAPDRPLTYHGHYLNVDHYIRASVDIPWALDPKAEEEYVLLPGPAGETHDSDTSVTCAGGNSRGHKIALLITTIIASVATMVFRPYGALAWLLVVLVFAKFIWNSLASKKLGAVSFHLANSCVSPGQSAPLTIECCPPRRIDIAAVTATLTAREVVVSGSGTKRTTHTKTVLDEQFVLIEATQLPYGRQELEAQVPIPETNAWTFSATDNSLKWTLAVRVAVPGWPDWVGSTEINLVPGPATAGA